MSGVELLLDGNRGRYIPRNFVEEFDLSKWYGIGDWELGVLEAGPDHEDYWEAWNKLERTAYHVDEQNNTWNLHLDGDLFLICDELMTTEEKLDMGFADLDELTEEHVDYLDENMPAEIEEMFSMVRHDMYDGTYTNYGNTIADSFTDACEKLSEWIDDNVDPYLDRELVISKLFGKEIVEYMK